jgi:hypothetical protein
MSKLVTNTRELLSKLASPDEFELLATAVLREAEPSYAAIIPVGTNASGRTVRSPVDGISFHLYRGKRRLFLVQHTITARHGLRAKWLDQTSGDVIKAKAIFEAERARSDVQSATLVLTTITDPDEKLIRDVQALAGEGLSVDLWSGSRISDFLDRHPEGQWLRRQQFGTEASRLSLSQARYVSQKSLEDYLPLVTRDDLAARALDQSLWEFAEQSRGAGFVIGESGLGKSVALRSLGHRWCDKGGIAIVLPHELVEQATTIEQAIANAIQSYFPGLDHGCGSAALSLATFESPLLLIIEDVNRSQNPRRIIERLVGWSSDKGAKQKGEGATLPWRILCPVWRGNAALSDTQLRDQVVRSSFIVERFEREEAAEAISRRALSLGVTLTSLQCNDLANALSDDPLLIGLNQDWSNPTARDAIQSYINGCLADVAGDTTLAIDLNQALEKLAEKMVASRCTYPKWTQIQNWFVNDQDGLSAVRRLISQGKVISL